MKSTRPIDLPLSQVIKVNSKSPIAMASISHRVSGVVLFLLIPVLLWMFQTSLFSPEGFDHVFHDSMLVRFLAWILIAAMGFHFVMGMKHLLGDMGMAEELDSGKTAAVIGFVLGTIWVIASFIWVIF